jgi:hypothetical protein
MSYKRERIAKKKKEKEKMEWNEKLTEYSCGVQTRE